MKTLLIAATTALLLTGWAQAQPAGPACQVSAPRVPVLDWQGHAAYEATATARDGRVVAIEVRGMNGGVERRVHRALVEAINEALQKASCQPGKHVFTLRFDFALGDAPASPSPPPATQTEPAIDTGTLPPHACRVDEPPVPPAVLASAWRGQASYLSHAEFRDGRFLGVSTGVLRRDVDAQVHRELMAAVRVAMTNAQCPPGQHVIERRFDFDMRALAPAAPSAAPVSETF